MARAIGVEIDHVELGVELAVATTDRDLGFLQIPAGSVAGIGATWTGSRDNTTGRRSPHHLDPGHRPGHPQNLGGSWPTAT